MWTASSTSATTTLATTLTTVMLHSQPSILPLFMIFCRSQSSSGCMWCVRSMIKSQHGQLCVITKVTVGCTPLLKCLGPGAFIRPCQGVLSQEIMSWGLRPPILKFIFQNPLSCNRKRYRTLCSNSTGVMSWWFCPALPLTRGLCLVGYVRQSNP